jgi:hypothetical protein
MKSLYELAIWVPEENSHKIDGILGVKTNQGTTPRWILSIEEKEEDEYIPFIDYFLSILEGKYDQLEEIGVTRDNITVWFVYYYDSQCNMEFSPKEMYNLGKEGITFCISCYDIHDYDAEYYDENGNLLP